MADDRDVSPLPSRLAGRWSGPVLWATLSQALSSLSNFGLYILLLLATDRVAFGQAVAVLAVYQLVLTLSRSLITEPHVAAALRVASPSGGGTTSGGRPDLEAVADELWNSARRRLGAFAAAGVVLVLAVASVIGFWEPWLLILAAAFPILLRQDGQRYLAWGLGRPELSVASDLVWLLAAAAGLGGFVLLDSSGSDGGLPSMTALPVSAIVVVWLAGGCAGAVFGWLKIERQVPTPVGRSPLPNNKVEAGDQSGGSDERLRQVGRSEALQNAAYNLLPVAVATVVSPSAAGLLKAGLLPFTPILALFAGLRVVSLPLLHRVATAEIEADAGSQTPVAESTPEQSSPSIDRVAVRILALIVAAAVLAVATTIGGLTIVTSWLENLDLPVTSLVWWGGAVTVMSVATKQLADALGVGRRPVAVVRRRLTALTAEWTFLFVVALALSEELIMVGWAVGVAVGTLIWLAPTLRAGPDRPRSLPAPVPQ